MKPSHPTRRDFAKAAVAVATAPLLTGSLSAPAAASLAAPHLADLLADALTDYIRARYGSRLSLEDLTRVRSAIQGNLQAAEQLRSFPLPISTEPVWTVGAYRVDGG
jgi:hypothetical protein